MVNVLEWVWAFVWRAFAVAGIAALVMTTADTIEKVAAPHNHECSQLRLHQQLPFSK